MSTFEKQVRKALIDRDMTAADLAQALGVTPSYISDILKGSRKADAQRARIMDYLELKGDEENEDDDPGSGSADGSQ